MYVGHADVRVKSQLSPEKVSAFIRFSEGSRPQLLKAIALCVLEAEAFWGVKSSYTHLSWAPHLGATAPGGWQD